MLTVDIKLLLERLNPFCTRSLEAAAGLCMARTHYEVTLEHFLCKLVEEERTDIPLILRHYGIDAGKFSQGLDAVLEEFRAGNAAKPVFSPILMEWLQEAWLIASVDLGEENLRSGVLLLTLLKTPTRFASGPFLDLLASVSFDELKKDFWSIVRESAEQPTAGAGRDGEGKESAVPQDATALGKYCVDFTEKARQGEIDPVFGRDQEIRKMIDILARRRKNNPIAVGEAGVGKTAVVEGLALRIAEGDVPELLQNVSVLGLDMGLLQ
ncbi:MAG: type VI secretion system ATPase TssH, partial [Candidatus Electrothrix sp. AUS4]|nr:type VI secretion system ATPase TssH [Candidatus Electrothrix sp. AUS4]